MLQRICTLPDLDQFRN